MKAGTREFAFVGIRLIAIYLIVSGLQHVPSLVTLADVSDRDTMRVLFVIPVLTPLIMGLLLFLGARPLTVFVAREKDVEPASIEPGSVSQAIFAATGLLIVALITPKLGYTVSSILQVAEMNQRDPELFASWSFLTDLAVLILGLSLFVGSSFWYGLYLKIRTFGLTHG